ncbi:hypothetical protein WA026_011587 [Henosepilachna vigintioctopunctata]|uniref:phytanoyl-CoA dioxygenase n=1 Tax=Henosepilachna vigintioctopunctata TaxID=420089 RepID=A0AAW1TRL9_9CUCU
MSSKRYTKNNKALTDQQRDFYEQNGYIIIKNNVPHHLIDELCTRFVEICENRVPYEMPLIIAKDKSLLEKGYTGQHAVNKFQDILHDDVFFKYACYQAVGDVVESIIGPNFSGVTSMFLNKPPFGHPDLSIHPLHQDLYYFPFRPINTIVGTWTAMEDVNEMNGCLFAVPGSHRREELYEHDYPKQERRNRFYHGVQGFENEPRVNFIMDKGDTVFFHPLLLHGSGVNKSRSCRRAISFHFADSNSYFIDITGTIQEKIVKEFEPQYKFDYMTIYRRKGRHVRGNKGSFLNYQSNL